MRQLAGINCFKSDYYSDYYTDRIIEMLRY